MMVVGPPQEAVKTQLVRDGPSEVGTVSLGSIAFFPIAAPKGQEAAAPAKVGNRELVMKLISIRFPSMAAGYSGTGEPTAVVGSD